MLKPLWFLIKLAILVYAVAWISERPGHIEIEWNGLLIEASFGAFLAALVVLIVICAVLYRFWRSFVSVPQIVRRYKISQNTDRGYRAVTQGLVAVAAGDAKSAKKQAERARKLVPDTPLAGLLMAQSALMAGDDHLAQVEFETLLEDKDAAFFGLRGLMNQAQKQGDYSQSVHLLRTAEELHPKRRWIIRELFDAETKMQDWTNAEQTLNKAIKLGVFDRSMGVSHRQAILVARAYEALTKGMESQSLTLAKKAFRLDASFIPASVLYGRLLLKQSRRRKAIQVIETAWAKAPHPDLVEVWEGLAPPLKKKGDIPDKEAQFQWFKKLYNVSPYHEQSRSMLGRAAMDLGLYAEAREYLETAREYTLLARLERFDTTSDVRAEEWLERALHIAPQPRWRCDRCGSVHHEWAPLCTGCTGFNTISWSVAKQTKITAQSHDADQGTAHLIDPPSYE